MNPIFREMLRYVMIGLGFGVIWAAIQFSNGQVRDPVALIGPLVMFVIFGFLMWLLRRLVVWIRSR